MNSAHFAISHAWLRPLGATFAAAAAISIAATDLSAQRRSPAAGTANGTTAVEIALRIADRLELTPEQREGLESLRVDMLERRSGHHAKMMILASEFRAGIRERSAIREGLAAAREEAAADRRSLREQYDGILTDEQKEELRRVTRRAARWRGAARGRAGSDRWRGTPGRPGIDRGRGIRGRGPIDRARGGERPRARRRPGGPAG